MYIQISGGLDSSSLENNIIPSLFRNAWLQMNNKTTIDLRVNVQLFLLYNLNLMYESLRLLKLAMLHFTYYQGFFLQLFHKMICHGDVWSIYFFFRVMIC